MKRIIVYSFVMLGMSGTTPALAHVERLAHSHNDASQLIAVAQQTVASICRQRNRDNSARRASCEEFQYRAAQQIDAFMAGSDTPQDIFHYQRCHKLWIAAGQIDFVKLASCLGLPQS